jgi:phenylpropionate dioxygenase-like ring-hydroxylating dioxygenase large terminal subunit
MGLLKALSKIRGGYPGGWRQYARGYQGNKTPPFQQSSDPKDRRSLIPPTGLREYWYPALPAKDISWKKPAGLRMLGEDLTFFRDKNGDIQALWDYCPHRGVYLSWGDCFWKGYLSCPYHGATFDGDGECVEFITEGPDSKMVGQLKAKKFPTVTLKGLVFVWMGEGEPVPPEEDIPPEFFQEDGQVLTAWRYWDCNWMVALENAYDSHVGFMVHRNSLSGLRGRLGVAPRSPIGSRPRVIGNKTIVPLRVTGTGKEDTRAYYNKTQKQPLQMHYPRINAKWPKYTWRRLWIWATEPMDRKMLKLPLFETNGEWIGQRLPGMVRNDYRDHMYTRWVIPVEPGLSRLVYFHSARHTTAFGRFYETAKFHLFHNFIHHFNFSDQDYDAQRSARYQYPEYLSATDLAVVQLRKLVTEHARGVTKSADMPEVTTSEESMVEAYQELEAQSTDTTPTSAG